MNYLSQDSPELQFVVKEVSKDMAKPKVGSWRRLKKVARFLLGRVRVVWRFGWQDEPKYAYVFSDSDWGGNSRDRRSTSGGTWRIGKHTIKTWSAPQGAYASSSAEAELYAMVEGVTRSKGLVSLAKELGYGNLSGILRLGTDSSAAKSFVCRRGLGRMRHLQLRDLWLQKEVLEGKVVVEKISGDDNPADLMTKILGKNEIGYRLIGMNLEIREDGKKDV